MNIFVSKMLQSVNNKNKYRDKYEEIKYKRIFKGKMLIF